MSASVSPLAAAAFTYSRETLFDSEDVDRANIGIGGQEVGADCGECLRDLAVNVRLAGFEGFEGVEDAVGRVADLEGVPGHGPLFLKGELTACDEKRREIGALVGLCFEEGEQSEFHGHLRSPFWFGRVLALKSGGGQAQVRVCRVERGAELAGVAAYLGEEKAAFGCWPSSRWRGRGGRRLRG